MLIRPATDEEKRGTYFKFMNVKQCHNSFQYQDGLNILKDPFSRTGGCGPGGLYFTTKANLGKYVEFGTVIREVTLPFEDPAFQMVCLDHGGGDMKWRANQIILGRTWSVLEPDEDILHEFKILPEHKWTVLKSAIQEEQHNIDGLRPFFENITAPSDAHHLSTAFVHASHRGNMAVMTMLHPLLGILHPRTKDLMYSAVFDSIVDKRIEDAITLLRLAGPVEVPYPYQTLQAIAMACGHGHREVLKVMIEECNVDIHFGQEYSLRTTAKFGNLDMVRHLIEDHQCDPSVEHWGIIGDAQVYAHWEVSAYLEELKVDAVQRDGV